jgi:hypothetical protein
MEDQSGEELKLETEIRSESYTVSGAAANPTEPESGKYLLLKIWLDFLKWFIGSVALVLIVFIFNWRLKERNEGLDEIKEYETHVELVTNVDNIAKRRLLAQFFASVTASETLKKGWKDYYDTVSREYREYVARIDSSIASAPKTPQGQIIRDSLQRKKQLITEQSNLSSIASIDENSLGGSARPGTFLYKLNVDKNRTAIPTAADFDKKITLGDLIAIDATENKFSNRTAVDIEGFVTSIHLVKGGSANFNSTDPQKMVVRIYLSPSATDNDKKHQLIANITPAMILAAAKRGEDYSIGALSKSLPGKKVRIQGWLFYNVEHKEQAYAENPNGQMVYRASCWEVTPVTLVKVVQ